MEPKEQHMGVSWNLTEWTDNNLNFLQNIATGIESSMTHHLNIEDVTIVFNTISKEDCAHVFHQLYEQSKMYV